ncbi:EAL domain-containing protein [Telmatospirillum sp.]|uniref:EAL domain-containing protein n=1 Tax=Telmatospirillum sp. TaxID=2079197 RepID=UPI00284E9B8D|nr:EAL domain-containing protein [Telmatospirillum sp.]MDR3435525.1 EAL domain-containing protein [Telmatospirillum sp.]
MFRRCAILSLVLLPLCLPFLVAGMAGAADAPPLVVVSDDNYPPYIFRDSDGKLSGYLVDAWALWQRKTGRPVDLVATDWEKAQQLMAAGKADVIDTIFRTPEREANYDFTWAYADIRVPIYVHASIGGIVKPEDLRGFLVGVKTGDACIEHLRAAGLGNFQTFDSYADLTDAAVGERIKIFCLDEPPANYLLYKAGADRTFYKAFDLYTGQFHRAVHKGDQQTLDLIERGFSAFSSGEKQALEDKWIGKRVSLPASVRYISYGLLAAIGVGGVLAVWAVTLRREVRRRTAELAQQSSRLYTLIETIPDLVWLKNPAGVFLTCNHEFERFFGATQAEIVGRTDFDFVDAELARSFRENDRAAIAAGKPNLNQEWVTYASDGRRALLETIKTPMFDDKGALIGVLGIARDITRMHRIEEELRQNEALLLQSQRLASVGHFVLDPGIGVLRTSAVFDEIFGSSKGQPGGLAGLADWVHPEHRAAFAGKLADFMREGGHFEWECPILRSDDGKLRWVKMSAEMQMSGDGRPANLFGNVQDITAFKQAEADIQQLAFFDPLTKLPNRRLLLERLTRAKALGVRNGSFCGLLFIDIDNFKVLNDTKGHRIGDLLLEEVARRLVTCVRLGDTVARFGGDEFVVMIESLSDQIDQAAAQADAVGEKIRHRLSQPYQLEKQPHHCAASLGLTLFRGVDVSNDDLLKQADLAMYQAKAAGRNTKRFFDPSMQKSLAAQAALEDLLRQATDRDEFVLYYQPQVARNGDIVGAEALIRWRHPERGLVLPAEFIPAAETSGLILPIGLAVLDLACRQLATWSTMPVSRTLSLAINVSARQFRDPAFVEDVRRALFTSGADPTRLKLELTESLLLQDVGDCAAKMQALRTLGVSLSLDDFGTGFSSLAYLKQLPFSQLKIDRSFVRDILIDPNDASIARTIILLAKSFGLTVIAEGVEQEDQWRFLAAEGCDEAQGFLYGRPMPATDFLTLITEWQKHRALEIDSR